jgi:predicted nuclease of predicted toxin-antitoxin system
MSLDFPLIIADESVDSRIITGLIKQGYSVYSILAETPGITDTHVIEIAVERKGFIITEDKDFGDELVYRKTHKIGGMLLRLQDMLIEPRVNLVIETLALHSKDLNHCFSVLTSKKLRIRKFM